MRVGIKNTKSLRWSNEVKFVDMKKEVAWKKVLAASDEYTKERCMEVYRKEKRKVKRCMYQRKKKVNE